MHPGDISSGSDAYRDAGGLVPPILAAAGSLWFLLAPWAEEPWLEAQYGASYRRYKEQHPRFVWILFSGVQLATDLTSRLSFPYRRKERHPWKPAYAGEPIALTYAEVMS